MVTNYPRLLTLKLPVSGRRVRRRPQSFVGTLLTRLAWFLCGLHGHDEVLSFSGTRILLRCTSCGHETPGWQIDDRPPRLRFEGDHRRHRLTRNDNGPREVARPIPMRRSA